MKKGCGFMVILFALAPLLFSYEYIMNAGIPFYQLYVDVKITSLTGGNWLDGYYDYALPSSAQFYFYGKKVTHLRITTKGYVELGFGAPPAGSSVYFGNEDIPSTSSPNAIVAVWWDDWDLRTRGEIWMRTSSYFTSIEWRDVPHYSDSTASYDFQVLFFGDFIESAYYNYNNIISFHYLDTDSGTGTFDYGKSGTIGIEHYTGAQGEKYGYNESVLSNNLRIMFSPFVPIYDSTDFWETDGNKPDLLIFRPDNGMWYKRSNDGVNTHIFNWGKKGDIALPGDYDGDGDADELVLRPENYIWYGRMPDFGIQWGTHGDIPVPADYDGNGTTDLAVFRPINGLWFIYYMPSGTTAVVQWGTQGDVPLPADYDNDGKADCAVFRPGSNMWYIRKSSNPASPWIFAWGTDGDIPMPANFQHTSYSTVCVYRPSTGRWFTYCQVGGESSSVQWGAEYDVPVPNDWTAGGYTDECVFRPTAGMWYIEARTSFAWGKMGDKPRCRRSFLIVAPPKLGGVDDNK